MGKHRIKRRVIGEHNYRKKLIQMLTDGQLDIRSKTVGILNIAHDNDCSIFQSGLCDCDPDITLESQTAVDDL